MNPQFYSVLGNRDHLKIGGEKHPLWEFVPEQHHYLTSLVYLKGVQRPPHARMIYDCGAWSYKHLPEPKWGPDQCANQYAIVGQPGDLVASPDHMVIRGQSPEEQQYRIDTTLRYARDFLSICPKGLHPIAVSHGETVDGRVQMVNELLDMGYRHIAVGSVAVQAGNRKFIRAVLEETARLRQQESFYLHVLGISALSYYPIYRDYGVDSFDGSSMFFSAFTAGEFLWHRGDGTMQEYKALKPGKDDPADLDAIPVCECPACAAMRGEGIDTRMYGSNEHNMGRAVHNIGQYLAALDIVQARGESDRQPALW